MLNELYTFAEPVQVVPFSSLKWGKFTLLHTDSGANGILGALVDLAASAINTAATDHIKAARKANYYILRDIPRGKYSPEHMLDKETAAEEKDVIARVK